MSAEWFREGHRVVVRLLAWMAVFYGSSLITDGAVSVAFRWACVVDGLMIVVAASLGAIAHVREP
jgi:hypothetical protein